MPPPLEPQEPARAGNGNGRVDRSADDSEDEEEEEESEGDGGDDGESGNVRTTTNGESSSSPICVHEAVPGEVAAKARRSLRRDVESKLADSSRRFLVAFAEVDKVRPPLSFLK